MPTVRFKMRDLQGAPIANTWFRVEPGYQDSVVSGSPLPVATEFYTNGAGEATAELVAGKNPYYLTKQQAGAPDQVAYKLFIPASTATLEAEVLYVDLGLHMRFTNDASLLALIDAKVAVMSALNQIKLISSVILPGSEGLQTQRDAITAVQAELTAYKAEITGKVDAAVAKADAAMVRANQAVNAVTLASANAVTAGTLAEDALAAVNSLAARVTALGG